MSRRFAGAMAAVLCGPAVYWGQPAAWETQLYLQDVARQIVENRSQTPR